MRLWQRALILLLASAIVVGCSGPTWPSRGLAVSTTGTGASALEVEKVVEEVLLARRFVDAGKGGRDEIKKQRTAFNFMGPNDIVVIVTVDRDGSVPIRLSQNRSTFSGEASQLYEDLASVLERRWPGAVSRDASATK